MKLTHINKNNMLAGPYIEDATIEVELTDELWEQQSVIPQYCAWKLIDGNKLELVHLDIMAELRLARQRQCFDLIDNRSSLWYANLTNDQKNELNTWYQAWLNVTKTQIIPEKPNWLK